MIGAEALAQAYSYATTGRTLPGLQDSPAGERGGKTIATANCPDCDAKLVVNVVRLGQKLTCPYCDTELEVIGVDPLELDWASDWSDDWEDYEEEW